MSHVLKNVEKSRPLKSDIQPTNYLFFSPNISLRYTQMIKPRPLAWLVLFLIYKPTTVFAFIVNNFNVKTY